MDGDENDEFEIPHKVDSIVEQLYAPPKSRRSSSARDRRDEVKAGTGENEKSRVSSATTQSVSGEDSDNDNDNGKGLDPYRGLFDYGQKKILEIKEQIEESDQSEEALVELLQSLADMDITFQALKVP